MTKRIADMTPEEAERVRARSRAYRQTPAGKAARAAAEEYRKSPEGKAVRAAYLNSPAGKASRKRQYQKYMAKYEHARKAHNAATRRWNLAHPDKQKKSNRKYYAKLSRKDRAAFMAEIMRAVPAAMPRHVRDDIAAMVLLEFTEHPRLSKRAGIAAIVKAKTTEHYRMFSNYGPLSLDEVVPGTDGLRRGDLIESTADHF